MVSWRTVSFSDTRKWWGGRQEDGGGRLEGVEKCVVLFRCLGQVLDALLHLPQYAIQDEAVIGLDLVQQHSQQAVYVQLQFFSTTEYL
jgi:hypothetical protein